MRHLRLTAHRCDETGEVGLLFDNQKPIPGYITVAQEGLVVAHDVIEHQQGLHRIGPVIDELYALGGVWHARGRWGDIRRDGVGSAVTPEENLAADVANMGELIHYGSARMPKIDRPIPRVWEQADAWDEICDEARRQLRHTEMPRQEWREYLTVAKCAMEIGYKLACRRFGKGYKSNSMFWNIAEAVGRVMPCEFEGQQYRLSYDASQAVCEEIYPEEIW